MMAGCSWAWHVMMAGDAWLGTALQPGMVSCGSYASVGWAGCMFSFNKICPEPRAKATRLEVDKSSGELVGVAHCLQLGAKCLCNPASHRWPCVFAEG